MGSPLYSLYSFRWAGLDPANGDPRVYLSENKTSDYNQTNSFKEEDLVYSGRYNPPIFGSLYNTFSWKGLSLSINLVYKFNYYFRRNTISYNSFANEFRRLHADFANRWQNPGDENVTDVPSLAFPLNSARDAFYNNSDILVEKGDHIRLQFINLGYAFENNVLSRIGMRSLQLYLYAQNLGIIWRSNKKSIDPDYPYVFYPPGRTYSIGLKMSFK